MATEVLLPKLGLTVTEGTVMAWRKAEGDTVQKGDILVEIETDKLTNEVEATASGVLLKIVVPEGETVPILTVLGYIGAEGEAVPEPSSSSSAAAAATSAEQAPTQAAPAAAKEPAARSGGKVVASPLAKRIAQEHGVDIAQVPGTGPNGRVQKEDVEAFLKGAGAGPGAGAGARPVARETVVKELSGMRKTIARRLSESWLERPHVTESREIDLGAVMELRARYNERSQTKTSLTDYIAFLAARAVAACPDINVSLKDNIATYHPQVNLGIAVALDGGLVVPVVKGADTLSFTELHDQIAQSADRARKGTLTPAEMSGGTFTLTNLGMYGIDIFTPIINPPESAILGVGRIVDKPMYLGEQIQRRPMCWFSLSFDHRVVDGAVGAQFLAEFERLTRTPALAFWH